MLRWFRDVNNRRVAHMFEMYRLAFMKAHDVFSWLERPLSGLVICKLRMVRQFLILACVLAVGLRQPLAMETTVQNSVLKWHRFLTNTVPVVITLIVPKVD